MTAWAAAAPQGFPISSVLHCGWFPPFAFKPIFKVVAVAWWPRSELLPGAELVLGIKKEKAPLALREGWERGSGQIPSQL